MSFCIFGYRFDFIDIIVSSDILWNSNSHYNILITYAGGKIQWCNKGLNIKLFDLSFLCAEEEEDKQTPTTVLVWLDTDKTLMESVKLLLSFPYKKSGQKLKVFFCFLKDRSLTSMLLRQGRRQFIHWWFWRISH